MEHLFRLSPPPTLHWVSVNELVDNFNVKITNIIDAIAPTKVKVVPGKNKSPWRNATLVKIEKRECWKAERWWRETISRFTVTCIKKDFESTTWN